MNMEIQEGNKLIAEFMECNKSGFYSEKGTFVMDVFVRWEDIQYHKDWNWLMPAWSKFYILCETTLRNNKDNSYNEFADFRDNYNTHANHNNVKSACETLVEALQWYNKEKESTINQQ